MKCFHCGAEVEDGCITCSHCGNPLEVVPDIDTDALVEPDMPNPGDADFVVPLPNDVIAEINEREERREPMPAETGSYNLPTQKTADLSSESAAKSANEDNIDSPASFEGAPKSDGSDSANTPSGSSGMIEKKKMYIILGIVIVLALALLILMAIFWRRPEEVEEPVEEVITYEDVKDDIDKAIAAENYGEAKALCEQAFTYGECDEYYIYQKYLEVYEILGHEDESISVLEKLKAFAIASENEVDLIRWYELLMAKYALRDDTLNLGNLVNEVKDSEIIVDKNAVLSPYMPEEPVFSDVPDPAYPGDYIYISSPDGSNIFMTRLSKNDVSEPQLTLYHGEGIALKTGRNDFLAVCENQYGLKSNTVKFSFVLKTIYDIDLPDIMPQSGEYREESYVEINLPMGYRAFYCWDDDPDIESTEYLEKVEMKEGNHVFAAIQMDQYGNISDIQRVNYIYIPEKDPEEEEEDKKDETEKTEEKDKDGKSGKNGGSKIIKDADDTPVYHGKVTDDSKDKDDKDDKDEVDNASDDENETVSGNSAVSSNSAAEG